MKKVEGVWLPNGDTHFAQMMARGPRVIRRGVSCGTYQLAKFDAAMRYVPLDRRRIALDIGAHVGFWSMMMAREFSTVIAFEPVPEHADCWEVNLCEDDNARLYRFALGAGRGTGVAMATDPDNSGKAHVQPGSGDAVALDSFMNGSATSIDLVKIDVEGYESLVIEGAVDLLRRNRPIIVVESNGQHERYGAEEPVKLLQRLGARVLEVMRHDVVLGWAPC